MSISERRIKVIHNPTAGQRNRNKLSVVVKALQTHAKKVKITPTRRAGDGVKRAYKGLNRKNNKKPYDVIAAAGGDGTIAEVANGMRDNEASLLILPLGTANVMARELGLGTNIRKIASVVETLKPKKVYPGIMGDKRFVMMVGAGFDSLAVASLETSLKRRIGAAAYVFAAVKAVKRFKSLHVKVEVDGDPYECSSVIVTNGRLYGGPFVISPNASLEDPEFHVVMFKKTGLWGALRYGVALALGRLPYLHDVTITQGKHVKIDSEQGLPIQADGDYVGMAPVEMHVDEFPLTVLAPHA